MANFLWKGSAHKISWFNVCLPLDEGGLGFKDLIQWNKSLMIYQICRIITHHDSIWTNWVNMTVLKRKHFWSMAIPDDCSWVWRNILKLRNSAMPFISYTIGNGKNINFWLDPWWQGKCLANSAAMDIILEVNSHAKLKVHDLISSGAWSLTAFANHPTMSVWYSDFSFPNFNLSREDTILWNGNDAKKVKF